MFKLIRMSNLAWQGLPGPAGSLLVKIRDGEQTPPVFFCCQNKLEATDLAAFLAPEKALFAMRSTGTLIAASGTNVKALALQYAREMVRTQPDGQFYIAGHCAGARVAWEVARQIIALGRSVALLALIERDLDSDSRSMTLSIARFVYRSRIRMRAYLEMTGEAVPVRLWRIMFGTCKVVSRGIKRISPLGRVGPAQDNESEKPYMLAPLPEAFNGRVALFYVRGSEYAFFRFRMFQQHWDRLAPGKYDVVMVPGHNHYYPCWQKIAENINSCISFTETGEVNTPRPSIRIQDRNNIGGLDAACPPA